MKNVAGYDVSRLIVGSFGCLGLVTEVSMKVLPKPRATRSLLLELPAIEVPKKLRAWRDAGLPVTGASHLDSWLHVRVEGGNGLVANAVREIGGEDLEPAFWDELRDQQLPFFADRRSLWRISVPQTAPLTPLPGSVLLDWGAAQRWLKSDAPAAVIRADAEQLGGHATLFSQRADVEPFHPMPEAMLRLHQRIKRQLDPRGIFNPARMYAAL
jgi:glycolate oxidase FAD binding subunit